MYHFSSRPILIGIEAANSYQKTCVIVTLLLPVHHSDCYYNPLRSRQQQMEKLDLYRTVHLNAHEDQE
jgi:hypothetical protein